MNSLSGNVLKILSNLNTGNMIIFAQGSAFHNIK